MKFYGFLSEISFPNLKLNIPSKTSVTKVVDEMFEFYNVMSTLSS